MIGIHDSFDPFQLFFSEADGLVARLALEGLHVVEFGLEVADLFADVFGQLLMVGHLK